MLSWHSAQARDRRDLQSFVCAEPHRMLYDAHRGRHHPRPYELMVQSHIRGLNPPLRQGGELLIGRDGHGIAAVIQFGVDPSEEQFVIQAVARAARCADRGYGRAAILYALRVMSITKEREEYDCGVFARIHPGNQPSKAAFAACGFERLDTPLDGYEAWVRDLPA